MRQSMTTWWKEVQRIHRAGISSMTLLTGNVSDLMARRAGNGAASEYVSIRRFLAEELMPMYGLVVFYDKATGFSFGDELTARRPAMRKAFTALVGIEEKAARQQDNPFAALAGGTKAGELPVDPIDALPLIEQAIVAGADKSAQGRRIAVIIDYCEAIVPTNDFSSPTSVLLQRWAESDSPVQRAGQPLVMIERNGDRCAEVLKSGGMRIPMVHVARPTRAEHLEFVETALERFDCSAASRTLSHETIANLLTGLRLADFEEIVLASVESGTPIDEEFIWKKKAELITRESGGLLEVVRPKHGFAAIGGLDRVVDALRVQVCKLREGSRTVDKGWILMGPPGTGKTILGEALATEAGCCMVIFRDVQSKYVGESERNQTLCLDIIRAQTPAIVFVDEAAEVVGSGSEFAGDAGVTKRLQGKLQNFIGDDALRGKVFWLFATNWPNRLPPAMMREGRMDKRVPILMPDAAGRSSILSALCVKHGVPKDGLEFSTVVRRTDRFSGAELEALLLRAKQFAEEADGIVRQQHLDEALHDFIPSRDERAVAEMTLLALQKTNSRRLLPDSVRKKYDAWMARTTLERSVSASNPRYN